MRSNRLVAIPLILVLLLLAPAASTTPAPATGGAASDLDGVRTVDELVTFTTLHPNRHGDTPVMDLARDYLADRLAGMGYTVEKHRYNGGTNIVGYIPGSARPLDWVVVSAHYDSVQAPSVGSTMNGAWDDGAGVVAALEIARVAAMRPWDNTVAIVLFDDEEIGLVGSGNFVTAYNGKAWNGGNIRLVANLNMDPPGLNWPCLADGAVLPFTMFQNGNRPGNVTGQGLIKQFAYEAKADAGVPDEYFQFYTGGVRVGAVFAGTSDNKRFWDKGIPEIWVGGSTHLFLGGGNPVQVTAFQYPLHTPADNAATMVAYCPNGLDKGFETAMQVIYGTLERIDAYGSFPRP